ncbi:LysR family transcriptional regulator [Aquitalea sp.]|uniref:LysR family transcriptional regulator n=1 Tax=Aquitalea sp. TaxID=1872623 RepID=UPI00258C1CCA|nr:LysR family transcriptional regulator [Aquitalea sp.]
MNITLRQLRAFVALARTGSFTLAAESLYITQSALSGLMRELENNMGIRLVDRSTRRVQLTEIGREFYPVVEKILSDLDHVLSDVSEKKSLQNGFVRVAAPQLMASTLLPELIAAYNAAFPAVRVKLVDAVVESIVSKVFSGEVDLGIGPEREPNSDIATQTLFSGRFMAVFPAGHPLGNQAEVSWEQLLAHPFISLQGQFTERLRQDLHDAGAAMRIAPSNEVAFMSTALAMVNAGLGVTACISYATSLVTLYRLEMRPLVDPVLHRDFYCFTQHSRSLSPAAQSFKTFASSYLATIAT